ncbi:hypothetical protein [Kiloniella antarctica]|uniref:Chemotaxis methyl-accepting receptor HlyB-like 4HB MCP domain-containing protein n=1 Tax=Kiloniella antarctica TaxID=1550907 RepID=A0ABW5BL94_9PROT
MIGNMSPLRLLNISGSANREYWFSQAIIILSTVAGVYLASLAGFQIAVNFDRYQSTSEVSYLEKSLRAEVADNITMVEKWSTTYKDGPMLWHDKRFAPAESHQLDDMIWKTMHNSPRTFEVKPEILTTVRRFYSEVRQHKTILFQQQQPNSLAQSSIKALGVIASKARTEILPMIDADIERLENDLLTFSD